MINILLIGLGPHAKRIYYPILEKDGGQYDAKIVCAVDLEEKRKDIEDFLKGRSIAPQKILYLKQGECTYNKLSRDLANRLKNIVKKYKVKGVIISTEPLYHIVYAKWAIKNGLSILMDKPISSRENVSTSLKQAKGIVDDYESLLKEYKLAEKKKPDIFISLMAQRRFHPAFQFVRGLIKEVKDKTNCPVTSIQSFHSDGQWRFPTEIVEQKYHPYNQGYGKCSHSGYHFFDITNWLIEAGESKEKSLNNADIFTNFSRPMDFLSQFNLDDYKRIFKDFKKFNKYSQKEYEVLMKDYGEIDAFTNLSFKHNSKVITLASINLIHNGFSQRNWVTANGRDLYKGNGRVRHESHYIEQGPFQAISFISYQSKEVSPENIDNLYEVGGEYHLDIHVFRNDVLFPEWKNYQKFSIKDLNTSAMEGMSRGHQEDARRNGVIEFILAMMGKVKKKDLISEYRSHKRPTSLLSSTYKSAVSRVTGKNSLINTAI